MTGTPMQYQAQLSTFEMSLAQLARLGRVPPDLTVSNDVHPVYVVRAVAVSDGTVPADEAPTSVQFSASNADGKTAVGEVSISNPNLMIGIRYSDPAAKIVDGIRRTLKEPQFGGDDTNVSMLRIPELALEGLWIRPGQGEDKLLSFTPVSEPSLAGFANLRDYIQWAIAQVAPQQRQP